MIRAVIFDCFGVLYVDSKTTMLNACSDPQQRRIVYDLYTASDKGYLSSDELTAQIAIQTGLSESDVVRSIAQAQQRQAIVFEYASTLKHTGLQVAVLSNFGRDAIGRLFSQDERERLFDTIVASGDIGITKPSPGAYEYTLEQLNVQAHEAIMIDDGPVNVQGAIEAGMQGVIFTDITTCKQRVEEIIYNARTA